MGDKKNTLVVAYLQIVRLLRPRFVVIENVSNLFSMADGLFPREITRSLLALGYQVLKAKEAIFFSSKMVLEKYRVLWLCIVLPVLFLKVDGG